ncbi:BPL-N domain-containing protein [Streptomyces somaliensis]|uniref:BPL-N domain-containing protein n=1 Tax=Streptomyces somaliensis TaxID=78355 RepID=UPI0020CF15AF|nr:BPL-N domain-containing protein [Streptomyces somaliensis]MCP9946622.1 BPL-N domain-containing protein [Streptomyces somaliensis]MCP9960241.1 BPL-N domain-containing protein [Streptomyces somaliensis]MCP9973009.1 BPL-N domain-containing protein [Streptomyces somaliensis]
MAPHGLLLDRRRLLTRGLPAVAGTLLASAACSRLDTSPPVARPLTALVYRGPAACDGCAEAAAALLKTARRPYTVKYAGPGEEVPLTAAGLADADLYVQPGGNDDLDGTWERLRGAAGAIRDWTRDGGRYLGICMGAYLAGDDPGFGLLPGSTDQYTTSPGASVHDARDAVVVVTWRSRRRHMYFQDGPLFLLEEGADASVIATYDNGTAAAVVAPYGKGRVGVVGPHPEADASWYSSAGLYNPDSVRFDLGHDLVQETVSGL